MLKLNLGCGPCTPQGWVNVDYALGARLSRYRLFSMLNKRLGLFQATYPQDVFIHDLTKKFPWRDYSVETIYSSHTLEHLSREQGLAFLRECYRVLVRKGVIRLIVPDLRTFVSDYMESRIRGDEFVEKLGVLYEFHSRSRMKRKLAPFIMSPHKCMYDSRSLADAMANVGFDVSRKGPFESDIPDISDIEISSRTQNAVILEGRKI